MQGLAKLLTHVYTGSVNEDMLETHALKLLEASNEYLLHNLKQLCENHMAQTLTAMNVMERMVMANIHQCPDLLEACFAVARRNIGNLFCNQDFKNIETQYPELWDKLTVAIDRHQEGPTQHAKKRKLGVLAIVSMTTSRITMLTALKPRWRGL